MQKYLVFLFIKFIIISTCFLKAFIFGRVAQLVEHYLDMVVVAGSSPVVATIKSYK